MPEAPIPAGFVILSLDGQRVWTGKEWVGLDRKKEARVFTSEATRKIALGSRDDCPPETPWQIQPTWQLEDGTDAPSDPKAELGELVNMAKDLLDGGLPGPLVVGLCVRRLAYKMVKRCSCGRSECPSELLFRVVRLAKQLTAAWDKDPAWIPLVSLGDLPN